MKKKSKNKNEYKLNMPKQKCHSPNKKRVAFHRKVGKQS